MKNMQVEDCWSTVWKTSNEIACSLAWKLAASGLARSRLCPRRLLQKTSTSPSMPTRARASTSNRSTSEDGAQ